MTNGTSQGLFIIVAIVVFSIFIAISFLLFKDSIQPTMTTIFTDNLEQSTHIFSDNLSKKESQKEYPEDLTQFQGLVASTGLYVMDASGNKINLTTNNHIGDVTTSDTHFTQDTINVEKKYINYSKLTTGTTISMDKFTMDLGTIMDERDILLKDTVFFMFSTNETTTLDSLKTYTVSINGKAIPTEVIKGDDQTIGFSVNITYLNNNLNRWIDKSDMSAKKETNYIGGKGNFEGIMYSKSFASDKIIIQNNTQVFTYTMNYSLKYFEVL